MQTFRSRVGQVTMAQRMSGSRRPPPALPPAAASGEAAEQTRSPTPPRRPSSTGTKAAPAAAGAEEETTARAVALYDYDGGGKRGRLALRKGETVLLSDTSKKDWWSGSVGKRSGTFPASYVKLEAAEPSGSAKAPAAAGEKSPSRTRSGSSQAAPASQAAAATVLFDYDAGGKRGRLSLRKGETVVVTERKSKDWWGGSCGSDSGLFPAKYVQLNKPDSEASSSSRDGTPKRSAPPALGGGGGGGEEQAVAKFDYDSGGKKGRLSLRKGERVVVTERKSKDWWAGRSLASGASAPALRVCWPCMVL